MCGIAGAYIRDPNLKIDLDGLLDTMLLEIEDRGKDATGFVAISDDGVAEWQKAACKASTFAKYRRSVPRGTRLILGHTRWATQGLPAFMENNHPIRRGPYFIIHNGHVRNDLEIFRNAARRPFGTVDSEAIAARLSSLGDLSKLGEVMQEIKGDAAVAAVDERDPTRLVVAKGSMSPLYVYNGRVIVLFASTRDAVKKAHEKLVGRMAMDRLLWLSPGTQLEWNGEEVKETEFKVEKPIYHWSSKEDQKLPVVRGTGPAFSWLKDGDDEEFLEGLDLFNCDNCSDEVRTTETNYRYDDEEKLTYMFCQECADLWDSGIWDDPNPDQETIGDLELQHGAEVDAYEAANNAILDENVGKGRLRRFLEL